MCVQIPPAFGNRADTWRLASLLSVLAKYGDICPLVQIPTLLINAKDDFHLQKDSEELLQWIRKYGTVINRFLSSNIVSALTQRISPIVEAR